MELDLAARGPNRVLHGVAAGGLMVLFAVGMAADKGLAVQDEGLPKAEEIIERYVEVTGGKEPRERLHNRVSKGTMEIVGMGIKGTITTYAAGPDRTWVRTEVEGIGTLQGGTNGEVAWRLSALQGPQLLEGAEKDFALRAAVFNRELQLAKLYPKMECKGIETVDDRPCYQVVMTPSTGKPETWYLDRETYLVVKMETIFQSSMGDIPMALFTSDYREVDGVQMPFRTQTKVLTQEVLTVLESVEHNAELPAGCFDLPEEIQMLIKQTPEGGTTD